MLEEIPKGTLVFQLGLIGDEVHSTNMVVYSEAVKNIETECNNPIELANGDGYYVHVYANKRVHAIWQGGSVVGLVIDLEQEDYVYPPSVAMEPE